VNSIVSVPLTTLTVAPSGKPGVPLVAFALTQRGLVDGHFGDEVGARQLTDVTESRYFNDELGPAVGRARITWRVLLQAGRRL
jgi:hypothetical protein